MTMPTVRLTVTQALVRFLASQYSERDGVRQRLIEGCWGIFGPGNVAGVGQAPAPSSESWWDVPVSQTSALDSTRQARSACEAAQRDQRMYL
jgi:TPP-dependent trihydroxycyclohexane-1,2-dione (THcHDO) dehydratase